MSTMKDYNYWKTDWPKIVASTYAHNGRMFEVITETDPQGKPIKYTAGRELTFEEALLNAHPDRRVMTMAVFGAEQHG